MSSASNGGQGQGSSYSKCMASVKWHILTPGTGGLASEYFRSAHFYFYVHFIY